MCGEVVEAQLCAGLALFMWTRRWTPRAAASRVGLLATALKYLGEGRRALPTLGETLGSPGPRCVICGLNQCDRRRVSQVPVARYGASVVCAREVFSGAIGRTDMGAVSPKAGIRVSASR